MRLILNFLLFLQLGGYSIQAAAPLNDFPATAQELDKSFPLAIRGNLAGVSEERLPSGAPFQPHPETHRPASLVWYRWTPSASGLVEVSVDMLYSGDPYLGAFIYRGNELADFSLTGEGGIHWVKGGCLYWVAVGSYFDWNYPVPTDAPFQLNVIKKIPPIDMESLSIVPSSVDVSQNAAIVAVSGVLIHNLAPLLAQEFEICRAWPGRINADRSTALTPLGGGRFSFHQEITIPKGSFPRNYKFDCQLSGEFFNSNGSLNFTLGGSESGLNGSYIADLPLPEVAEMPLTVINQANSDFYPPFLSRGSLLPAIVVTDGQTGHFEFEAQIDDDASGFDPAHPDNYIVLTSYGKYLHAGHSIQQISGNDRSGRWRWTFPLPRDLPTGSYRLSVCLVDKMGRRGVYGDYNFADGESFGWPSAVPRTIEVHGSRGYEAWCFWNSLPRPDGSIPLTGPLFTPDGLPAISSETGLPYLISYAFDGRELEFELNPRDGTGLMLHFWRHRSNIDGWPLGLRYQPQFAGSPAGPWLDAPDNSLMVEWQTPAAERVSVPDPAPSGGARFGRVKIEYTAP